ncbi:MAG: flotillin-like FloA family protein, partial [Treponema sp.]|nr:flotillin-like FloA family protein [Treponema sp.]
MPYPFFLIPVIIAALVALGFLMLFFRFFGLWFRALLSGAHVGLGRLIGMWLRHVNPGVIVDSRIMLAKAGIDVSSDMLETHFLARGDVLKVSRALVAANKANIPLPFQRAAAIDLAGRDVLDAVRTSVNPKVIDCPDHTKGKVTIDAVAKDGIQLQVKARVTVRANIERLVGGATEETIIARVGEGIV